MRFVIVGAGEVGFHIAQKLSSENKDVTLIDKNAEALRRITEHLDVQAIEGSGCDPHILKEAGLGEAETFLAVTDSDETNLIACFFANLIAPNVKKLARIRNEAYTHFQPGLLERHLKIDKIINPDRELVATIERFIMLPDAEDVSEFADGRIQLIGFRLSEGSEVTGMSLAEIRQRHEGLRFVVGAIFRNETLIVPKGDNRIEAGDFIYVVCERKLVKQILRLFGCYSDMPRNILIIGGGKIGLLTAKLLETRDLHIRILEKDRKRCDHLSELLNRTLVIHGDGTDQQILEEENISRMELVLTLTGDEETNILCSLLAKRLGAQRIITRISKFSYMPIVYAIGLTHVVNPRLSAINSILHYIRRGKILSAVTLRGEEAEVLEVEAMKDSDLVGRPLRDLKFPRGALVLAVIRAKEIIIPTGETAIHPSDRVIILAERKAIPRLENQLSVRVRSF
ncbi:MAG: Trk system potassium transporter TrkA [Syntrophobacterales bacterium]|nr:Trk system potassium transporter TrkA [Syntrophobacterales bacterium]